MRGITRPRGVAPHDKTDDWERRQDAKRNTSAEDLRALSDDVLAMKQIVPDAHVEQILDFVADNYGRGGAFPMAPDGSMESWHSWFNRMLAKSLKQTGKKVVSDD